MSPSLHTGMTIMEIFSIPPMDSSSSHCRLDVGNIAQSDKIFRRDDDVNPASKAAGPSPNIKRAIDSRIVVTSDPSRNAAISTVRE